MSKKKWGESFLKTGLPLEHLAALTFHSLKWSYRPHYQYTRKNREGEVEWFEHDLVCSSPPSISDTLHQLEFIVECKYHDQSRFWFFLPLISERRKSDDFVFNQGPIQTLESPFFSTVSSLAPRSYGGVVVSEDGAKQENSIYTALQQLSNGYLAYCSRWVFGELNFAPPSSREEKSKFEPFYFISSVVPMVVTNARIFRLKLEITDLDLIRDAESPNDIADEVNWTWCYFEPSPEVLKQNNQIIKSLVDEFEELQSYPEIQKRLEDFIDRPNWFAITNVRYLEEAINSIYQHLHKLPKSLDLVEKLKNRKPAYQDNNLKGADLE